MATHDPKKPEPAHGGGHAHGTTGARTIEHIQADLDDVKAQLAEAMPLVESDSAKQRRQLERIDAAKRKWTLTHEPDDPFDPSQFEPPMVPLKIDPARQREFHGLHYRIAKLESEMIAATKTAVTG